MDGSSYGRHVASGLRWAAAFLLGFGLVVGAVIGWAVNR